MKKTIKIITAIFSLLILCNIFMADITLAASSAYEFLIPGQAAQGSEKIAMVKGLPSGDWTAIVAAVIKMMLQVCGALSVAAFTYGGVMMITAQGNDEKLRKGKGIIYWSLLALIIIAVSYAVILGVTQLKFFGNL